VLKKELSYIIILTLFCCSLIRCTPNNNLNKKTSIETIKLDFLVTPDQIIVYNTELVKKLQEVHSRVKSNINYINNKYEDYSKLTEEDRTTQENLVLEINKILEEGKVIDNFKTIGSIFEKLKKVEGKFIESFDSKDIIAIIHLNDDDETQFYANVDSSYYRQLMLLQNGYIIIPKIVRETGEMRVKTKYIKAKLSNDLVDIFEILIN